MAQASFELDSLATSTSNHITRQPSIQSISYQPPNAEFSLPPVDTGKQAWLLLAACWAVEALVFGFGFSFGVFQDFYTTHPPFSSSNNIAIIGTTTMGVMYIGIPFGLTPCRLYPRWARWFTLLGLSIASLALATSSFCTNTTQLIGTQGILLGLGGFLASCPSTIYIDEWFIHRKGMAYGIVWSAAGLGGAFLPLLLQSLLDKYGFQTATRVWACILFVSSAPLTFFIKPRLPYAATTHPRPINTRSATSTFFLPGIYLSIYARTILNISVSTGYILVSPLTDYLDISTCILVSAIGAAASALLIWGFASFLPVLYLFCILYGLFAGCWTSLWPGIMRSFSA
ncbi:MFS general substrate transporter [Aspergillus sclerotioniger CBS 115572]|uniref:MFS general substrate transporter n=1 Tax=Aspergillus sclerotioniger CBS 115572 TaxID=1450535 RepID=A0A317X8A6_9EURO|nr:MFS general substrate transporter [Aspergillus sclerotioniger CBS 115572]PWY93138.1 MFS general substrate transporter [Aspergillus sclerotioniger CBS 115572]